MLDGEGSDQVRHAARPSGRKGTGDGRAPHQDRSPKRLLRRLHLLFRDLRRADRPQSLLHQDDSNRRNVAFRFGRTRTDLGVDLGNLLNTNYATAYEGTYQYSVDNTLNGGTWNNPTAVYTPRFVRVNATFDF